MKLLKIAGKIEKEKSDIAKVYEERKDKTEFDGIKRVTLSEYFWATFARPSDRLV